MKNQLAEGSKDQVAEEADDGVDDGEHGACVLQAATGAQEQAGTDSGTDGDHLELTCAKPLVEAFLLVCERVVCRGLDVRIGCGLTWGLGCWGAHAWPPGVLCGACSREVSK